MAKSQDALIKNVIVTHVLNYQFLKAVAEQLNSRRLTVALRYFRILTTAEQENAKDWTLIKGVFAGHESCITSLLKATTEHICSLVATRIICIPVCYVLVVLCFGYRIAY